MIDYLQLRATVKIKGSAMKAKTIESAMEQVRQIYITDPAAVRDEFLSHIDKLLDMHECDEINFEQFVNFMTISCITTNGGIILCELPKKH